MDGSVSAPARYSTRGKVIAMAPLDQRSLDLRPAPPTAPTNGTVQPLVVTPVTATSGLAPVRQRPRRRRPRWQWAALALMALVGVALYRHWVVLGGPSSLTALGTLEATEVTISAEVSARIREVAAVEGQVVQAGQVLVQLDDTLPQLQYQLGTAAEQRVLAVQLEHYTVRAPLAGVVLRRSAEPGEIAQLGGPLLVVIDTARPKLTLYVLQRDLARVYVGQPVVLEAEALSGATFDGVVESVADQAEYTPRNTQTAKDRQNLVFAVKVRVDNADRRLKPGMNITARFAE
jgi:multidrug resistance efflux pump